MKYKIGRTSHIHEDAFEEVDIEQQEDCVFIAQADKSIFTGQKCEAVIALDLIQAIQVHKILSEIIENAKRKGLI